MSVSEHLRLYEPDECGSDGYPLAWHDLGDGQGVKHLVREQAGHRCVRCGHPYRAGEHGRGEWTPCDERCMHDGPALLNGREVVLSIPARQMVAVGHDVLAQWRILTVHHLRLGADAKRDLRWWNLAALCQRCHLQIQGKVQMERVYPWPHSDWFKPYAAGWYSWVYEQREVTREEAIERMDELLAYERMVA